MQVYALDENRLISTIKAKKGENYRCPECLGQIRLRRGDQRQPHFFHPRQNPSCRQSQKGAIHLLLQHFIKNLFNDAHMEYQFPQIGRIADVAHPKTKIIFEIQYSPLSLEEARQRCHDYESLGYQAIWILHDHTFNQKKMSSSERYLRSKTCYFSNMNVHGKGMIYDQFEETLGHRRQFTSYPRRVNLQVAKPLPPFKWPPELVQRAKTWPLYHEGDLLDLALKGRLFSYKRSQKKFFTKFKEAYLTGLQLLLEKI